MFLNAIIMNRRKGDQFIFYEPERDRREMWDFPSCNFKRVTVVVAQYLLKTTGYLKLSNVSFFSVSINDTEDIFMIFFLTIWSQEQIFNVFCPRTGSLVNWLVRYRNLSTYNDMLYCALHTIANNVSSSCAEDALIFSFRSLNKFRCTLKRRHGNVEEGSSD